MEIIKLKRKQHRPKRHFCPSCILTKFKSFLFPHAEIITSTELINKVKLTFGTGDYHLLIADSKFRTISVDGMKGLLKKDNTDQLIYTSEYSDCDDFADVASGSLTKMSWLQGYAIGVFWFYHKTENWGHAINIFYDGDKIWCFEPQNDSIYEFDSTNWVAYVVKF